MADKKQSAKTVSKAASVDYKAMDLKALRTKANELSDEVVVLKKATILGDVQNVRACKFKRRELARVLTLINSKTKEEKN